MSTFAYFFIGFSEKLIQTIYCFLPPLHTFTMEFSKVIFNTVPSEIITVEVDVKITKKMSNKDQDQDQEAVKSTGIIACVELVQVPKVQTMIGAEQSKSNQPIDNDDDDDRDVEICCCGMGLCGCVACITMSIIMMV